MENREYVKCIKTLNDSYNDYIEGEIYKVVNKTIVGRSKMGSMFDSMNYRNHFVPSTKEAYEAQNKPTKVLIFNDIYVGDIVVSLVEKPTIRREGDIFQVLEESRKGVLYYRKEYSNHQVDNWRKATPEEVEAYNKGIRNIKDIVKKLVFEVGKWYKDTNSSILIIKFDRREGENIYSNERINDRGYTLHKNDLWLEKHRNWVLLTDLSEIQSYLPNGHPDKTPQFVVGKWYKSDVDKSYSKLKYYYLKCLDAISLKGETIDSQGEYSNIGSWSSKETIKQALEFGPVTDLSEIQQYLPNGHVDKIIKPKENPMYTPRKGDYFVVDGKGTLYGRIILMRYDREWENTRCYGPMIDDFKHERPVGNFKFKQESGCCFKSNDRQARPATQEEKRWLDACISKGEFVKKEEEIKPMENLVGRYLMAKKDGAQSIGGLKKGQYVKIISESNDYNLDYGNGGYSASKPLPLDVWELMPIGWTLDKQENVCTGAFGLKVGDKLDNRATLEYLKIEGNFCPNVEDRWKHNVTFGGYDRDRTIESFREIDGIMAFKVSGCAKDTHYLKAEGFKEFMEEFNKPMTQRAIYSELTSLPEKWCIKVNKDIVSILDEWRRKKPDFRDIADCAYWLTSDKQDGSYCNYSDTRILDTHTQITFEQFKKWVLKDVSRTFKFEIGQKVIGLNKGWQAAIQNNTLTNNGCSNSNTTGRELTIKDRRITDLVWYEVLWKDSIYPYGNWISEDGLEAIPMKEEFKVGDWVKVITNGHGCGIEDVGTISQLYDAKEASRNAGLGRRFAIKSVNGYITAISNNALIKALPHEIPKSKETLLELAKRLYPIGTTFKTAHGSINTVSGDDIQWWTGGNREIGVAVHEKGTGGLLYDRGKWSEIISTPAFTGEVREKLEKRLEELNPRFEVGQKVRCIRPKDRKILGYGWKEDVQFTIDRINRYADGDVLWAAGSTLSGGVYSREVELLSRYYIAHDPYEKREVELISSEDNDGMIEPSIQRTKAIRTQLIEKQEVVLF